MRAEFKDSVIKHIDSQIGYAHVGVKTGAKKAEVAVSLSRLPDLVSIVGQGNDDAGGISLTFKNRTKDYGVEVLDAVASFVPGQVEAAKKTLTERHFRRPVI